MKIIDNGKEYIYMTLSGEEKHLEYGSILIRMGAFLKNTNFHALYLGTKKPEYRPGQVDDRTANIFIEAMIKSTLANSSRENDKRMLEILYDEEATPQRELITEVVKHELMMAEYQNGYEIIHDKKISEEFEKILMGELDTDIINKLLGLGKITYTSTYDGVSVVREIELTSIGQIISLEIENIVSRKNPDVIYRRCIQCGNIFVTCGHAGNQDRLCNYKYKSGLCKERRQKELNAKRDPCEVIDNRIFGSMYKRKDRPKDERDIEEFRSWKKEYLAFMDPYKHSINDEEYDELATKTWKTILKRINGKE